MTVFARPRAAALALALATAMGGLTFTPAPALAKAPAKVDIAYDQFTLPNGLRVIVAKSTDLPIVNAQLVIGGELTVGELIAFNMLAGRVSGRIKQ